eukprot:1942149-Prymnesium_polylepis.1
MGAGASSSVTGKMNVAADGTVVFSAVSVTSDAAAMEKTSAASAPHTGSKPEQELREAVEARLVALEPLVVECHRALDGAFSLVVLRTVEGALRGPNCKDELKSALSSVCEAACALISLDHSRFILCGGREKAEPLMEALQKTALDEMQISPEVLTRCAVLVPNSSTPPPALLHFDEGFKLWKGLAAFVALAAPYSLAMQSKEVHNFVACRR